MLIGVPLGILMAYKNLFNAFMRPILDGMQTMPSFVYLIPALLLFGMGKVPAVFATMIYAIPPVIRLTDLGIRNVPKEMVEAAHSFGSSNWQTLMKIQLPQALPTIMTGINQTIMMALAMVVIASMIGAKGLGLDVLQAIQHIDIGKGFEAHYDGKFVQDIDRSKVLQAQNIMFKPSALVSLKDGIKVAIKEVEQGGISSIFVLDYERRLQGLVTIDDAIKALKEDNGLRDILKQDFFTTGPETYMYELIPYATETKYPIAVVDEDKKLLGIIVRVTVLSNLV